MRRKGHNRKNLYNRIFITKTSDYSLIDTLIETRNLTFAQRESKKQLMARFEMDPQYLFQIAKKLSDAAKEVDPDDPVYASIFEGLPDAMRNQWIEAIKDCSVLVGFTQTEWGKEIIRIAVENGLAPQGTRRLPHDIFNDLRRRSSTLRNAMSAHSGIDTSKGHAFSSHISSGSSRR